MDAAFWQSIKENDYAVPQGYTVEQLVPTLLDYLESPDPHLRDDIGYYTLAHWMVRQHISPNHLRQLIDELLPKLARGLGENGTESVFGRSFAALMLAHIVNEDNKQPFLSEDDIKNLLNKALAYLAQENDLRGFIEGKGWAHACAHTADWLLFLARNRYLNDAELTRLLDAIADKVLAQSGYLYIHGEDARMARAVAEVLRRETLPLETVQAWAEKLLAVTQLNADGFVPKIHSAYFNTKNLLQSVYFHLAFVEQPPKYTAEIRQKIIEGLKKFPH